MDFQLTVRSFFWNGLKAAASSLPLESVGIRKMSSFFRDSLQDLTVHPKHLTLPLKRKKRCRCCILVFEAWKEGGVETTPGGLRRSAECTLR